MNDHQEKRKRGRPKKPDEWQDLQIWIDLDTLKDPDHAEGWIEYQDDNLPDDSTTPDVYEHIVCGYPEFDVIETDVIHIPFRDIPVPVPHYIIYPSRTKKPVWLRGLIKQANREAGQEEYKSPAEIQEIHKIEVARLIKIREQAEKEEAKKKAHKEEMRLRRLYFRHHLPEIKRQSTIVEVNSSSEKFKHLKKQKKLKNLTCRRCNSLTIKECRCPNINDRLRKVCFGHNACVLEKWCVICDRHEILCTCKFKYGSTLIPKYLFYGWYLRKSWYTPLEKQYYAHMEKHNVR